MDPTDALGLAGIDNASAAENETSLEQQFAKFWMESELMEELLEDDEE